MSMTHHHDPESVEFVYRDHLGTGDLVHVVTFESRGRLATSIEWRRILTGTLTGMLVAVVSSDLPSTVGTHIGAGAWTGPAYVVERAAILTH